MGVGFVLIGFMLFIDAGRVSVIVGVTVTCVVEFVFSGIPSLDEDVLAKSAN